MTANRTDRVLSAFTDVLAVEHVASGMVEIHTLSKNESYVVDVRNEVCLCPDFKYHLEGQGRCKHIWAALDATEQLAVDIDNRTLFEDLDERTDECFDLDVEASRERLADQETLDSFVDEPAICEDCGDDLACFKHFDAGESEHTDGSQVVADGGQEMPAHIEEIETVNNNYLQCSECKTTGDEPADIDHRDACPHSQDEPTQSEPADYGGGDSTGVQDL